MTTPFHGGFSRVRRAMLAVPLLFVGANIALAASMTVNDGRPVAKAIEEIEAVSGRPIAYEDPPYVHRSTTEDPTAMVGPRRAGGDSSALVPRGGVLTFALPANGSAAAQADALENMVTTYNAGRGAATFSILRGNGLAQVVPRQARGLSGRLQPVTPVLDTKITLKAKPRNALELLREICLAVSAASRQRVEIGMVPANALRNQRITTGASNEPARDVLRRLILANINPLAWRLYYDPGLKTYYLNIPVIRQPSNTP